MPVCQQFVSEQPCPRCSDMEIIMSIEEYETIRLIDYLGMNQEAAASQMDVGRATVQALYTNARRKLARYLVEGTRLSIRGGNYEIHPFLESDRPYGQHLKGDMIMKIAVTYENGQVFQHFGHTEQFKIYTVEDGKIVSSEVVDTNGSGHGALAGFLEGHEVSTLICGGIGGGAKNALAEMGIELYAGAAGDADSQVESFLAGSLSYDPNTECNHHHGEGHEGGCGHHGQGHEGGCGHHGNGHEGGCGHHGHGHGGGCGHHGHDHEGGCGHHEHGHEGGCGHHSH